MDGEVVIALLVGVVQGIFEWLPISSEGNVTILLTALGYAPELAVGFSLFLHVGTAISATVYYRDRLWMAARSLPEIDPASPFTGDGAEAAFIVIATLASGVVGIAAYATLETVLSAVTGGAFVAAIGALLVATGLLQRVADAVSLGDRERPDAVDAVLVGALQGLAILPGVSRSGTTVSGLLLRGHGGEAAFRLSFLLSVPAALGAGVLAVVEAGGIPAVSPTAAVVALATAAVVGYATIDALLRVVRRIAFSVVCIGLGGLAIVGGVVLALG